MKQADYVPTMHLGIVLDRPPEEVSPEQWTGCSNVAFTDGKAYRTGGHGRFADPLLAPGPLFTMNVLSGAESYWLYCTALEIIVTDGFTHWIVTPAGGLSPSEAGDWCGCILNGIPVLNNGSDPPMFWSLDTGAPMTTLPGWPAGATCKAMRATKYHLIALNITDQGINYPQQGWWSNGAQAGNLPTEWIPTASNDAGDFICADTPGEIIDGLALRDTFMVYKAFSTYVLQYVAGTYVFTSRLLYLRTGVQALNCVVEADAKHYLFTGTDVIAHDGQNIVSVVDEKVQKTLVQAVDPGKKKMCCVESRILNKQIWVCIPEQGSAWLNKAYVVDIRTGDIGIRLLPQVASVCRGIVSGSETGNSWDADNNSWDSDITFWDQQNYSPTQDSMLMVDPIGHHLFSVDTSALADGQPVPAYVERLSAPLGQFEAHKVVTEIVPRIKGNSGDVLMITLGGQPWFDKPITWGLPQPFVIGTDNKINDVIEGRLLSIRFEGTTAGVWELYKYAIKYAEVGEI